MNRTPSRRTLLGALGGLIAGPMTGTIRVALAQGQTLRIGMAAPNTTMDPHLQSNAPNNAVATHIYDTLVTNDEQSRSAPGLATAWRVLDDTHWEFDLRPDVRFSDGSPLTPEDIAVSVERATTIPSTASFRTYTRSVKSIASPSAGKLLIETKSADPLLTNSLSRIRIISAKFKDAPSSDFNAGRAAIGTGPYILKEYVPGSRVVLAPNPTYWGPRPPWSEVVLRVVTDAGARLAALLSGDLDIIEQVPFEGIDRVKKDQRFQVIRGVSSRFVYLSLDTGRDVTPFITGPDGKPLAKNPLKDRRVRQALSMAINRQGVVDRVMEGNAVLASQFLPPGAPGTSPDVKPVPFDPNKAKAMLAEAGYPNGFRLTIHGPNDRFVNDDKIVQAVGQMFARIGIDTRVEVMPWSVYSTKVNANEFSVALNSWGVNTGETSNPMLALVATFDKNAGTGASNSGRYSNPELDAKLAEAMKTLDEAKRNNLLAEASAIVFNDTALLPMHHEVLLVAARKGLSYTTRADQYTLAMDVKPSA
jgi:peptide/nickel transport system substrate-binding protein